MKQFWIWSLLLIGLLACNKERTEDANGGASNKQQTVTVGLRGISIGVDASSLSAIGFTMGEIKRSGGGTSIGPKVTGFGNKARVTAEGKTLVKVVTALSNGTSYGSAELEWEYTAASVKSDGTKVPAMLRLKEGTISVSFEGQFSHGSSGWYMCGLIGGTYNASAGEVTIVPTQELKGVPENALSGAQFDLEVPIGFPWTPVVVQNNPGTSNPFASNHYTAVGSLRDDTKRVTFKPLGSVIGYQLGNSLVGSSFTPTGFTVYSDAFTHAGSFNLKTPSSGDYPSWRTSTDCDAEMRYTFASSTPAGTLSSGQMSPYRYYAWVMPLSGFGNANTRVVLDGSATGGGVPTNRLNMWRASYTPNGTGRPALHKAHTLKASLSGGLDIKMPLEAVTERNLAGGRNISNFLYPLPTSPIGPWPGMEGHLRFANSHDNNASGYYNWYIVAGHEKGVTNTADALKYNPQGHNLLDMTLEGDSEPIRKKYFVPELEDWWGVFVGSNTFSWSGSNSHITKDFCRLGGPMSPVRFTSGASFSNPITPHGFLNNREVYALRFIKAPVGVAPHKQAWYNHRNNQYDIVTCYPLLTDNRLAMAFKYTRVGSHSTVNLTDHLKVESFFLGEDGYNSLATKDAAGVRAAWSSFPSGEITTRTFPAAGYYTPNTSTPFSGASGVSYRGVNGSYWSATQHHADTGWNFGWSSDYAYSYGSYYAYVGMPVRLFLP